MASRKGRVNYTPQEDADRKNFFLQRLRNGFSRLESQKQFAHEFNCSVETARLWYNKTATELIPPDLHDRRRTHAVIVEMYHTQITSMQADLMAIQNEIVIIDSVKKKRDELIDEIVNHGDSGKGQKAGRLLELLGEFKINTKLNGLEAKSKARERMFKAINELAKLQGVYETDNNWTQALHVLLDNGLLPPASAEHILTLIDGLTQQVQQAAVDSDEVNIESVKKSRSKVKQK